MATMSYRMIVSYSNEKQVYVARAPELESCSAEGATRADAVAKLEEEIAAQVENMEAQGIEIPPPIEQLEELDGKLTLNVSSSLHRELTFLAKAENVDVETLVIELLARGVSQRWGGARGARPRSESGPRRSDGTGSRYHNIMENRADFIEYVRSLEKTGQGGGNRGPGGQGGGRGGPRGRR
jgi:predicted RNase H-like HicB family nuclease